MSQKPPGGTLKQVPSLGGFEPKVSKVSYSESVSDFSNFGVNLLSTFAPIFSECKSESDDSESDSSSVFMNLDICVLFTLYLHSSK